MADLGDDVQVLVSEAPLPRREVTDTETLRVMSDPLRIAILRTFMADAEIDVRVMSAKELAAELGEPQTKLYRHLKQLEDAKLIEVAETRVVSGITEQRYRTAQLSLLLSPALLDDPGVRDDLTGTIVATLDGFRDDLRRSLRAGRVDMRSGSEPAAPGPGGLVMQAARRMNPVVAQRFSKRLAALVEEVEATPDDPTGVPVRMLVSWYGMTDPESRT